KKFKQLTHVILQIYLFPVISKVDSFFSPSNLSLIFSMIFNRFILSLSENRIMISIRDSFEYLTTLFSDCKINKNISNKFFPLICNSLFSFIKLAILICDGLFSE